MMTWMLALALQNEPSKDIYDEISKRNSFSPRIEKPPAKVEGPVGPPPPPPPRPFAISGLWWDPIDKAYVTYVTDVSRGTGKTLKAGDTHFGAKIDAVTKNSVTVTIDGKPQTLAFGGEFNMVGDGSAPAETSKPAETKPTESQPIATETKPPEKTEKKPKDGKGLLDWFRTRKKDN